MFLFETGSNLRLYKPYGITFSDAERHLGVQPPAGPPKLDHTARESDFFFNADLEMTSKKNLEHQTNLDARGEPSTVFPRGRRVETEPTSTYEALFDA